MRARDDAVAGGDEQADREQQGVAGQEREEQAALDEHDQQAHPEEPGAELVEQPVGVHPVDPEHQWLQVGHPSETIRAPRQRAAPAYPCGCGPEDAEPDDPASSVRRTTRCRTAPTRSASGRGRGRCPTGEQYDARAARRGRPAQRGRPLPLLDPRGDRRRPRHEAPRLPRRDRELAARLQHRHDRAHRQRLPGPGGAHRRQAAVEPARGHGHRPLPARAPPRDAGDLAAHLHEQGVPADGRRQPAGLGAHRDLGDAARGLLPVRAGGSGPLGGRRGSVCDGTFSIAQFGSTRSINASAAAAIAMHAWIGRYADLGTAWRGWTSRSASCGQT